MEENYIGSQSHQRTVVLEKKKKKDFKLYYIDLGGQSFYCHKHSDHNWVHCAPLISLGLYKES
jgi:hypothetical protein